MNVAEEIKAARSCGVVRCGIASGCPSLEVLAAEFGLSTDTACYHEISAAAALRLALLILTKDLAYGADILQPPLANSLAERFFAEFGAVGVRCFTNGNFGETRWPATSASAAWHPATSATFDTGLLILGPVASGVLWVEDED